MSTRTGRPRRRPHPSGRSRSNNRAATGRPKKRSGGRQPFRIPLGSSGQRLRALMLVLAIVVSLCAGRLVQVQALDVEAYAAKADARLTSEVDLPAVRGQLRDRADTLLATTEQAVAITADPKLTGPRAGEITDILARYLEDPDPEAYRAALTKPNTRFSVVARKVPVAQYAPVADELRRLGIYGVFRKSDPIRTYPEGTTGAAVLGFVNSEGTGRAGFEMAANERLAGVPGRETFESSSGYRIPLGQNVVVPPVDGVDYQLTLDAPLQGATERRLAEGMRKSGATSGAAVVLNVKTGEVLALANTPGFDPNVIGRNDADHMFNRAINQPFEPGSTAKVLAMAAALDTGTISSESRLVVPGGIRSGGATINDYFDHGTLRLTARGVLAKSSNIGMVMIGRELPDGALRDYLTRFGMGQRTGIEQPGEATGLLARPENFVDGTSDRATFGQAYSATAIQMAAAIGGAVNGGVYVPPTLIKSATGPDGQPVEIARGEPRRVISADASAELVSMMNTVVDEEVDDARIEGYEVAGKTGTAQQFNTETKRYDSFATSFIGVAPAADPTLLTYVVMQGGRGTGTSDAVPVFRDVLAYALPRYGIVPTGRKPDHPNIYW